MRPAYAAAVPGTAQWDRAAGEFAATRSGEAELRDEMSVAVLDGDVVREMALLAALDAGARIRAVSDETRGLVAAHAERPAAPTPPLPDLEDLCRNLQDPVWVANWNSTPVEDRTPIRLVHDTSRPDVSFEGVVHFGDRRSAMDRIANTIGDEDESYLVEVEWRGDLHVAVPDTVANFVAHPENAGRWRDEFYEKMTQECEELGVDEDASIESAEAFLRSAPGSGLAYVNNCEGDGDEPAVSLVMRAPDGGFANASVRPVDESDWEFLYGS